MANTRNFWNNNWNNINTNIATQHTEEKKDGRIKKHLQLFKNRNKQNET